MRIPTRDEIQPIANEQAVLNFIPLTSMKLDCWIMIVGLLERRAASRHQSIYPFIHQSITTNELDCWIIELRIVGDDASAPHQSIHPLSIIITILTGLSGFGIKTPGAARLNCF